MGAINVAVAGVGNCCSALVQGVYYYRDSGKAVGLLHEQVSDYRASDIVFVSAFDIDSHKVGKDLSEAIFSDPNNTPKITDVPDLKVKVVDGVDCDSAGNPKGNARNIVEELQKSEAEILINLISGGSPLSSSFYAKAAIDAGCGFLNATPSSIANDANLVRNFESEGLPIAGDDLLDQVGATVTHMGLLEFLNSRGVRIDESYQLDVGGGTESLITLEKTRDVKRMIKTAAVASSVPYAFPLVSGSTDYVDFLGNQRDSFFWIRGRYFGGAPFTMDIRLSTADAPNAGSILLDVIRGMKLARDRGLGGVIMPLSSYGFKNPPIKCPVSKAYEKFLDFIK